MLEVLKINSKSQVFFYTLMLGILVIVLALSLAGPVKDIVDSTRSQTTDEGGAGLDCSNSSISTFDKGACIVSDLSIFHFIGGLIFIAGSVITAKLIFNG